MKVTSCRRPRLLQSAAKALHRRSFFFDDRTDPPQPPRWIRAKLRVTLQTIHPVETQDDNVDQLYVLVKGSFVGMLNVSNLSYWNLNVTRDVYAPADVSLYDDDWPSSDDWLGTAWLDPPALGASYTKTIRLYGSGAVYDLTVKVTRIA
jgi:hypothetical protein